jgi:hypothetical protein
MRGLLRPAEVYAGPSSSGGGGGAPTDATYVTLSADPTLSAEAVLGDAVIMRGAFGSIPSAGTKGRVYISSDTFKVYWDDGAAWQAIGAGLDGAGKVPIAQIPTGTSSSTVAIGNDSRITGALQAANNLSDVTASTARTNLGLGTAATQASSAFDAAGAASAAQAAAIAASQGRLTPTAVKTANYSAAVGDLVPCDTQTTGAFTVTLPTAPADGSVVAVSLVKQASTNAVTLAAGGADVFDVAGGTTTATVVSLFQVETFQYKASTAIWYRLSGRLGRSQLDARYAQLSNNLSDVTASTARTNLGVAIGTNVEAWDATLDALAGVATAADKLPYFTGTDVAAVTTFTAAGRALVDDADAAAQRTTLGLVIGTNVQAQDAELSAIAGLTSAADKLPYFTGSGTAAAADFTAAGRALVDDADAAAQRTTLGLGTAATQASSAFAQVANNLSDVTAATARTNLNAVTGGADVTQPGVVQKIRSRAVAATAPSTGQSFVWDNNGATFNPGAPVGLRATASARTGALAENHPRDDVNTNALVIASGTLRLSAIWLPKGLVVTNLAFVSGATAAASLTHWWFALLDSSFTYLRSTADQTSTAWAASTEKIVALASTFTTTYEGVYHVGVMVAGTTPPSLVGKTAIQAIPAGLTPILAGNSNTGLTTPQTDGTVATTPAAGINPHYAYVS